MGAVEAYRKVTAAAVRVFYALVKFMPYGSCPIKANTHRRRVRVKLSAGGAEAHCGAERVLAYAYTVQYITPVAVVLLSGAP